MFTRWLTYITEGSVYAVLEIFEVQGREVLSLLVLKKEKGELVVQKAMDLGQIGELKEIIGANIPLFLSLNTNSVLTKPIADLEVNSQEAKVNHTFPNLDLGAFYYDLLNEEVHPMVSIARKDYVEGMVQSIVDLGLQLRGVRLGLAGLGAVLPYLPSEKVQLSNFAIDLEKGILRQVYLQTWGNEHYHLNGLQLQSRYLLGFAHILGHLEGRMPVCNLIGINENLEYTGKNNRTFYTVAKSAVLFFLTVLLLNFFVFDHYHRKAQAMETDATIHSAQVQQLKTLSTNVTSKQERVTLLNKASSSRATHFLDQLAQGVPGTVLLEEIKYQPLRQPFREGKSLEVNEGVIEVTGISSNSVEFSKWVAQLEEQKWIGGVAILGYDFVTKESSGFSIKITLNNQ